MFNKDDGIRVCKQFKTALKRGVKFPYYFKLRIKKSGKNREHHTRKRLVFTCLVLRGGFLDSNYRVMGAGLLVQTEGYIPYSEQKGHRMDNFRRGLHSYFGAGAKTSLGASY
jgi:hypothetical protein